MPRTLVDYQQSMPTTGFENTWIIPKTAYSLPTTAFTEKECGSLNTSMIDKVIMLDKLQLNHKTPKADIV